MPKKVINGRALLPAQVKAIAALLTHNTVVEAAAECGLDRKTIAKWLRDDENFIREFRRAADGIFRTTQAQIKAAQKKGLEVLLKLADGKDKKIALEAARDLIRVAYDADLVLDSKDANGPQHGQSPGVPEKENGARELDPHRPEGNSGSREADAG